MGLDRIETIKIKVCVGDAILFVKEVKENLSEFSFPRDTQHSFSLRKTRTFDRNNSAVRIITKVNDIGVTNIYPCANVKNGVRAGFVHDKNVPDSDGTFYFPQCQLCASRPVCVKGCRQKAQEVLVGNF